jgi:ribosomal protein L36
MEPVGDYWETKRFQPFFVPAQGDVFDFEVTLKITWRGSSVTRDQLREMATRDQHRVYWTLRNRIVDVSRNFQPHRALDLERQLNETLDQTQKECALVRRKAKVRVLPEERVREKLRPYWERRIEMDSDHELRLHRLEQVHKLTREWSEVLEQLHQKPFAVPGAKLAEKELATIMEDVTREEQRLLKELLGLLEKASRGHSTLGLYEYAETYDKLMKEWQRQVERLSRSREDGTPSQNGGSGSDRPTR